MSKEQKPWIGVDLDGTLAHYDGWKGPNHIGEPIPEMVERVKAWLAEGKDVRIFTARVAPRSPLSAAELTVEGIKKRVQEDLDSSLPIYAWCVKHLGCVLPITSKKDLAMVELWDDRCVCVEKNTGRILGRNP